MIEIRRPRDGGCPSHRVFRICAAGEIAARRPCPGPQVSLHQRRLPDIRRRQVPNDASRAPMARQFIYHMEGLTKTYPGNRKVLENINLSFYPDAKIGVLGVNGSGKSTLLRIMAGLDKEFSGEAWVAQGARVGYLSQGPQLEPDKSVGRDGML